jgi:hypothetical protein
MVKSKPASIKGLELNNLYSDFHSVIQAVNSFEFSISKKDKLTALKLAVSSSMLLNGTALDWHTRGRDMPTRLNYKEAGWTSGWNSLSLFIITEEVWLVRKIILMPNLNYKFWPSLRSKDAMREFMLSCHDCIVIITNPCAEDMPYITEMLKGKVIYKSKEVPIRVTIWVIMNKIKC